MRYEEIAGEDLQFDESIVNQYRNYLREIKGEKVSNDTTTLSWWDK